MRTQIMYEYEKSIQRLYVAWIQWFVFSVQACISGVLVVLGVFGVA